jgi:hypothetical protein
MQVVGDLPAGARPPPHCCWPATAPSQDERVTAALRAGHRTPLREPDGRELKAQVFPDQLHTWFGLRLATSGIVAVLLFSTVVPGAPAARAEQCRSLAEVDSRACPTTVTLGHRLVRELVAAGTIPDDWRPAFEAVPRHAFIPDLTWQYGTVNGRWGLIRTIASTTQTVGCPPPTRTTR